MDFVFDELANGRRVKTLTIVDDCNKEAVQIAVDTSIPALYVTRVLDQVKAERGLPKNRSATKAGSSAVSGGRGVEAPCSCRPRKNRPEAGSHRDAHAICSDALLLILCVFSDLSAYI